MGAKRKPRARQAYELRIQLDDIDPPIWRRIAVQQEIRLPKLHETIQIAMGWESYHLHEFRVAETRWGIPDPDFLDDLLDEHEVSLAKLASPGEEITYVYDLGDNWRHRIVVQRAVLAVAHLQ